MMYPFWGSWVHPPGQISTSRSNFCSIAVLHPIQTCRMLVSRVMGATRFVPMNIYIPHWYLFRTRLVWDIWRVVRKVTRDSVLRFDIWLRVMRGMFAGRVMDSAIPEQTKILYFMTEQRVQAKMEVKRGTNTVAKLSLQVFQMLQYWNMGASNRIIFMLSKQKYMRGARSKRLWMPCTLRITWEGSLAQMTIRH